MFRFRRVEKTVAIKALDESIAHWERLRDGEEREVTERYRYRSLTRLEAPTSDDCACCQQYVAVGCIGCPIAMYTNRGDCHDTPYYRAASGYNDRDVAYGVPGCGDVAIDAQVVFLEIVKEWIESQ